MKEKEAKAASATKIRNSSLSIMIRYRTYSIRAMMMMIIMWWWLCIHEQASINPPFHSPSSSRSIHIHPPPWNMIITRCWLRRPRLTGARLVLEAKEAGRSAISERNGAMSSTSSRKEGIEKEQPFFPFFQSPASSTRLLVFFLILYRNFSLLLSSTIPF